MEPEAKRARVDKLEEDKKEADELEQGILPKISEAEQAGVEEAEAAEDDEDEEDEERYHNLFEYDGVQYSYRERPGLIEELEGRIEFRVVNNDGSRESFLILTGLKNIFQRQLPKMPREYISRLVYDRNHVSIAVVRKPMTVVGGIAYRPFESHRFAEIVFCAISSSEQVRGYGAHMMNHLKDYVKNTTQIMHFLTYADNYAIGYFKKQGFTKDITLPKEQWMGYIKDYEGGTLMQCTMVPRIRYLDASKILLLQKAAINKKIREISRNDVVYPGIEAFKKEPGTEINPMSIAGVKEAGWTAEIDALARRPKRHGEFAIMQHLLGEMQAHPSAWPFTSPVSKEDVPDYYDLIKEPMDLSTMELKVEKDQYDGMESFVYDARLIFDNCRKYNGDSTTYYKNANKLEKFFYQKLREFPEYEHLAE